MRSLSLSLALMLTGAGCTQAPPPAPTVGTLQPGRAGVALHRAGHVQKVDGRIRVETGAEVRTPAGVRASLFLDSGAWVLLDGGSAVVVAAQGFELRAGRAWVDARHTDPVQVVLAGGALSLSLERAGLAVSVEGDGARAYLAAGQVTWKAGPPQNTEGGRLESGLSLVYAGGKAKETAQSLWDDWTLGLAEPGPLRPLSPAGVGVLAARRPGEAGAARTPLTLRRHEVRVSLTADLALTEVEQTFFNSRSEVLEGVYTVRLPEAAILEEFAVGEEDGGLTSAQVLPRVRAGEPGLTGAAAQLEWIGAGRYRGALGNLLPSKTRVVRLRYLEWLPHLPGDPGGPARRTYVYPMGGGAASAGEAPNLGDFSLEVDLSRAEAGALRAGMGAQVEGGRVVLRRSEFRPRADFVLDVLDPKERKGGLKGGLEGFRGPEVNGTRYLLTQPVVAAGPPPTGLELVLIVDVSAGIEDARLDLAKATARALLQQLGEKDRVAVLVSSLSTRTLSREPMGPASKARIEELIDDLGRQTKGGASDLSVAFSRALELSSPRGVILYLGDGRPTVGPLLPGELSAHLQRLGPLPRMHAVAVGPADVDLLQALCQGGDVLQVDDQKEAARAALHLIERAAQPALLSVTVSLGEGADVVYPEAPVTVPAGEALTVVARLRADRPQPAALRISGLRDGAPFSEVRPLLVRDVEDRQDLSRRFGQARLLRLLARGAGREAATDIGTRYGVVTPFTALIVGVGADGGGRGYQQLLGEEDRGTFVPPALRGRAPEDSPLVLEGGVSTTPARVIGLDELYVRALRERQASARVCYDRKAAGHPELSGRVVVGVKLALDGRVTAAKVTSSTLRDRDVEGCIERALATLKLPPPPDGKPREVSFPLQLEQEADSGPRSCSAASRAYLSVRRTLWRERLSRGSGPGGAMAVWREARARCELSSWVDRRALLSLLLVSSGRTAQQVDLYHRFEGDPDQAEVQEHLRREILLGIRTQKDIQAAQAGLALDGGIDPQLLLRELAKEKTLAGRIAKLKVFLRLAPTAMALRVQLLQLLSEAGQKEEARRLVESLRGDPGADAAVRQAAGEFILSGGDGAEAARAFSEIVEFAPFDPWGRRRLGDLYQAHGFAEPAYREYQVLGWLLPQDESVFLLLANAAYAAGRSDEALRLLSKVAEAVGSRVGKDGPAAWARALYALRLSQLREAALGRKDDNLLGQLVVRGRSDGLALRPGESLVLLVFGHPDAGMQLYVNDARAAIVGGAVGIEAQSYDRGLPGELLLSVRRSGPPGAHQGEVFLLTEGRLSGAKVQLGADAKEARLLIRGGVLTRR